ncbi:hypothetical protein [Catenuloplanes japonicus]|uniref:hypothetical protein n=1 Tax=Catenuloplanes japonicus TaxID=33876 RepID=UPI000524C234|nr:hypothetical protein [Catenuloplanes japonicus]
MGNQLESLEGWGFPVHVSPGGAARGRVIADQAERMVTWLRSVTGEFKIPPLYVVGRDDWDSVAAFPVYGMPHETPDRVVVGQEPAEFWDVVLDSVEPYLTAADRDELRRVYGDPVSLGRFADLLVSHEIGHYLHGQSEGTDPTSFWLREMLANLALQGYVTEVEPALEDPLLTVVRVVWRSTGSSWQYSALTDMHHAVSGSGPNYVWFEFGLQTLTKRLWQSSGVLAVHTLIDLLHGPVPTQDEAIDAIGKLDPEVAADLRRWPAFPAS